MKTFTFSAVMLLVIFLCVCFNAFFAKESVLASLCDVEALEMTNLSQAEAQLADCISQWERRRVYLSIVTSRDAICQVSLYYAQLESAVLTENDEDYRLLLSSLKSTLSQIKEAHLPKFSVIL